MAAEMNRAQLASGMAEKLKQHEERARYEVAAGRVRLRRDGAADKGAGAMYECDDLALDLRTAVPRPRRNRLWCFFVFFCPFYLFLLFVTPVLCSDARSRMVTSPSLTYPK